MMLKLRIRSRRMRHGAMPSPGTRRRRRARVRRISARSVSPRRLPDRPGLTRCASTIGATCSTSSIADRGAILVRGQRLRRLARDDVGAMPVHLELDAERGDGHQDVAVHHHVGEHRHRPRDAIGLRLFRRLETRSERGRDPPRTPRAVRRSRRADERRECPRHRRTSRSGRAAADAARLPRGSWCRRG